MFIRHLAPHHELPPTLIPVPKRRASRPPHYVYGWSIDVEELLKRTKKEDVHYVPVEHFPADWDVTQGDSTVNVTYREDHDETVIRMALSVTDELGIKLSTSLVVYAVLGPGLSVLLVYSLYDNYHYTKKPSDEDIQKIRETFGFTGEPGWYPSVLYPHWREPSSRRH